MRASKTILAYAVAFTAFAAFTGSVERAAHADVLPPDTQACGNDGSGKVDEGKVGTACQTGSGGAGKCLSSKCSKLDYAGWDRDASPSPPTVEYDCLKCTLPAATGGEAGSGSDAGSTSSSSGGSASGCNTAGTTARTIAPWLLGLVVAVAMRGRRKREPR